MQNQKELTQAFDAAKPETVYSKQLEDNSHTLDYVITPVEIEGKELEVHTIIETVEVVFAESPSTLIDRGFEQVTDVSGRTAYVSFEYNEETNGVSMITVEFEDELTAWGGGQRYASRGVRFNSGAVGGNARISFTDTIVTAADGTVVSTARDQIIQDACDKYLKNTEFADAIKYKDTTDNLLKGIKIGRSLAKVVDVGFGYAWDAVTGALEIHNMKTTCDRMKNKNASMQSEIRGALNREDCKDQYSALRSLLSEVNSYNSEIDSILQACYIANIFKFTFSTASGITVGALSASITGPGSLAIGFAAGMATSAYLEIMTQMLDIDNDSLNEQLTEISDKMESAEARIQDVISKCKPTPTPTPTTAPTKKPTSKPTSTPEPPSPDKPSETTPTNPNTTQADPSGYVYEGITANRLEGVKAMVYYQDENGKAVLWNAEDYDQINPQYTSVLGTYQWFVPKGLWQVTYEKENYEPAKSEWLVVPPPQMEVNYGLISYEAPYVTMVELYEDCVYVTFSKYMKLDQIDRLVIQVDQETGEMKAVNAQESPEGEYLANRFCMTLKNKRSVGQSYHVEVKGDMQSYAGVSAEALSKPITCKNQVKAIELDIPSYLNVGEQIVLKAQINASSYEGVILTVESDHDALNVNEVGDIDKDGEISITVTPRSSGIAYLSIGVEGAEIEKKERIIMASEQDTTLVSYALGDVETKNMAFTVVIIALSGAVLLGVTGLVTFTLQKKKRAKNQIG